MNRHSWPPPITGLRWPPPAAWELQRHRPDHQREDRVRVGLDGRQVRAEVLGAERRPDLLDDLAAALLERLLEAAHHLVAERVVGGDHRDLLVALLAGPFAERVARLRAGPAGR
jgi:hypothetical protein